MPLEQGEMLNVSVVYVTPQVQTLLQLQVAQGTTLSAALVASGILQQHQLSWPLPVGVFGLRVESPDSYQLQAGDRIELYRPLTRDPKDVRRQRAARHPVGRRVRVR